MSEETNGAPEYVDGLRRELKRMVALVEQDLDDDFQDADSQIMREAVADAKKALAASPRACDVLPLDALKSLVIQSIKSAEKYPDLKNIVSPFADEWMETCVDTALAIAYCKGAKDRSI